MTVKIDTGRGITKTMPVKGMEDCKIIAAKIEEELFVLLDGACAVDAVKITLAYQGAECGCGGTVVQDIGQVDTCQEIDGRVGRVVNLVEQAVAVGVQIGRDSMRA